MESRGGRDSAGLYQLGVYRRCPVGILLACLSQ